MGGACQALHVGPQCHLLAITAEEGKAISPGHGMPPPPPTPVLFVPLPLCIPWSADAGYPRHLQMAPEMPLARQDEGRSCVGQSMARAEPGGLQACVQGQREGPGVPGGGRWPSGGSADPECLGCPPGAGALEHKQAEPQRACTEMSLGLATQDGVSQRVPVGHLVASANTQEVWQIRKAAQGAGIGRICFTV